MLVLHPGELQDFKVYPSSRCYQLIRYRAQTAAMELKKREPLASCFPDFPKQMINLQSETPAMIIKPHCCVRKIRILFL